MPAKTDNNDFLKPLGSLALASRLRRLSDLLMNDVSKLYREHHVKFEARWFALLYLLHSREQLSVVDAARLLGFTHPAIIQLTAQMEEKKLLKTAKSRSDGRKRLISITPLGKKTFSNIQPLLDDIRKANDELLNTAGPEFLKQLSNIETAFHEQSIYKRVKSYSRKKLNGVEILSWDKKLAGAFHKLNMEWIEKLFRPEPADLLLLKHPEEEIINKGGEIFFARCNSKIAGTVAMIPHGKRCFELAKMGVTEKFRGYGIAHHLMQAAINFAKKQQAETVILDTNSSLQPAIALYSKYGFRQYRKKEKEIYERSDVYMKLKLK